MIRCLALLLFLTPLAVRAGVIDVHPSAKVSSGVVRLGDVADIAEDDPETAERLEAITLGPVPGPGRKLRITQQTIRRRLLAYGVNLSQIEFAGQSLVVVESDSEPAPAQLPATDATPALPITPPPLTISEMQRRKAEDWVQQAFRQQYHTADDALGPLDLRVRIADDDIPLILDLAPQRLRFAERGLELGGPQSLTLIVPGTDGETTFLRLEAWLSEAPQILTVAHTVPKGQVLTPEDVVEMPAKDGQAGLQLRQDVIGQEAARDLRPGQPLHSRDITKIPLVRNNDLVTVRVRSAGLTVSRVFRSSGSGARGEIVTLVALEDPREKLQATVTGWHEAEVGGDVAEPATFARRGR
jgi:flagella basal body P-ring formation protein FlgA